ncbi:MAG: UPF0182 family protein [Actinomycetota bacterium]
MRNSADLPPRRRTPRTGGFRIKAPKRSRTIATLFVGLIVVLFISARSVASFYVDVLWHNSLGRSDVLWGVIGAKALLGVTFVVVFALLLTLNLWIADRMAPIVITNSPEQRVLSGYQQLVGRHKWLVRLVVAIVLGFMVGLPAIGQWQEWLLFRNFQAFGVTDPLFNHDISFYVFRLPFIEFTVSWLFGSLVLISLVTGVSYYLNGGIRVQADVRHVTPQAKAHLSVLFAALALVRAVSYWLSRFELTRSTRSVVQGATYTDVKAQLPAINLMILVSIAVALLFLWNVRQKGWRLPVLATLMWVVVAVAAGTLYPAIVQRFSVQPNVSTKELPYIARNIAATKLAMGISNIEQVQVSFGVISAQDVTTHDAPLRDVRQLDPTEMRDRFALDEGLKSFYSIRDLDVDRYSIDGRTQQVVVGARELNPDGIPNRTWVSRHLLYTHGCGLVGAPASIVTADGRPMYVDLDIKRPQLYVGENLGSYSIVGTSQIEQACPDIAPAAYTGDGGVKLSSKLRRLAFAVNFSEYNLFGSNLITKDSRIMWIRDVKQRAEKIAPFLRYDADPYPAVVDGKVVWILDAYTTTDRYPYAQKANVSQLTAGSGLYANFNYVRNSVKVIVDAYTGGLTFYLVDPSDPIAATWAHAFPRLMTPVSEASADLVAHFRYPEDLFRVQTNIYGRYHFDDSTLFFNRDAAWSVAQSPSTETNGTNAVLVGTDTALNPDAINVQDANVTRFEPYYTIFHAPNSTESSGVFSMLRPFVPFSSDDSRKELRAFMVVSSDPRTYGKITIYEMNDPLPDGPATIAAEFGSDPTVSQQVTLLDQRGSRVVFGDLQMVPVGQGLVFVRPLYVRPEDANEKQVFVRKFLASYNKTVVISDDLTSAIAKLFPGFTNDLGDRLNDGSAPSSTTIAPSGSGSATTGSTTTIPSTSIDTGSMTAAQLLAQAEIYFNEADAALGTSPPNFALYQEKLAQARELIRQALELVGS